MLGKQQAVPRLVESGCSGRAFCDNRGHRSHLFSGEQAIFGFTTLLGDALQDLSAPHQPWLYILLRETPIVAGPRRGDVADIIAPSGVLRLVMVIASQPWPAAPACI